MDKQSDIDLLRNMCEITLIRFAENGDLLSIEDLYSKVTEQIGNLQGNKGLHLSDAEIKQIIFKAKEEFDDTYVIWKSPEEEEFGF